jgi:uncharacterized protein (DUF488 family)
MTTNPIFTIGHSTHSLERFVSLLRGQDVTAVTDVRSMPYSRVAPHFSREPLEKGLKEFGIKYVFLGAELGARSNDPSCYQAGRVQYSRLAQTPLFRAGIDRVVRGADLYRIALMCSEREPLACHRTILIARVLSGLGISVKHILADGRVETHDAAIERLLRSVGLSDHDFFKPKEALVAEALTRQEERIAYTDEKLDLQKATESA